MPPERYRGIASALAIGAGVVGTCVSDTSALLPFGEVLVVLSLGVLYAVRRY